MNKRYTFIIANGEGNVSTKNGVFHPEQLSRILMTMQFGREKEETKVGYLTDKFCEDLGYKKREDVKTKLLKEQFKTHQEKIDVGEQHTADFSWSMGLSPYENQKGEIGYLLSLSQYYLDGLDRLGIRYNQI